MSDLPPTTDSSTDATPPAEAMPARPWIKPVVFILVIIGLFIVARALNLGERLDAARDWIDGFGAWAPLVFITVYILATLAMIPGVPLTAAAGGLFGGLWGTIYVSIASTTGAALCFLVARYAARDAIGHWLTGKPRFRKLDTMTESHGAWMVAIVRLIPLFPFNLTNYGFGLTGVKFWQYVVVSWVCMIPGTVLWVVGTDALITGLREGRVPWGLAGVVAGMLVLLTGLSWYLRGKLKDDQAEHASSEEGAS